MRRGIIFGVAFAARMAAGADRTVWDGVYTAEQAARGQALFDRDCRSCHRAGFQGQRFVDHWREDKLSSLFEFMRTRMPADAPGSKSRGVYLDILTYILSVNDVPSGPQELTAGNIGNVQFVGKEGPAPMPSGALVRVAGCLGQLPDDTWILYKSSDPVRTREQAKSTEAELRDADVQQLLIDSLRLPEIEFYNPERHKMHKVAVKGFLDRDASGQRLLVTALQTITSNCPE